MKKVHEFMHENHKEIKRKEKVGRLEFDSFFIIYFFVIRNEFFMPKKEKKRITNAKVDIPIRKE